MPPHPRALRALLPLLVTLSACGAGEDGRRPLPAGGEEPPTGAGSPVEVVDASGRTVSLPAPARRVVSLVPSATLTLDALDARSALVGRTDFDTVTWAADLPSVGGGLEPNLEAIVALEPDAVIRFAGDQDPETPARLDELGIPHLAIRPDRVREILSSIRLVGTLVGRRQAADSLARSLETRLDSIRAAHDGGPSPRVAYILGGTPPWVAGPGTYLHELIVLAGGENVFDDLGSPYASVSPEELVARDIDVILTHGESDLRARFTGSIPIRHVSHEVELPGPGVARAAAEVARLIHGSTP